MDNRSNTIAGWVLGAGIVALGASIVTGEMFHQERPEKMGYPIEGVVERGRAARPRPSSRSPSTSPPPTPPRARHVFKKCTACHTINQGGANGTGPNLWGVFGKPTSASMSPASLIPPRSPARAGTGIGRR